MNLTATTTLRVRYAETDQMGVVYHSNYLIWFEVGRAELLRSFKLPYTLFEEEGLVLAVIEANCRYRYPAYYDEEVIIKTTLATFSSRKVVFTYEALKGEKLLAQGTTTHLFLNKNGRPTDAKKYSVWGKVTKILATYLED